MLLVKIRHLTLPLLNVGFLKWLKYSPQSPPLVSHAPIPHFMRTLPTLDPQAKKFSSKAQSFSLVFRRAFDFRSKIAVIDNLGEHTYDSLILKSFALSEVINDELSNQTNARIAFLCPNNASYIITQWACWISRHVAVPLNDKYPHSLLKYFVEDSQATLLLATKSHQHHLASLSEELGLPLITVDDIVNDMFTEKKSSALKQSEFALRNEKNEMTNLNAMILYTSGTTGPPKGVVLTHSNIHSQATTLIQAWKWTSSDMILHTLPLHHTHGIINALICPLYVGATCVMLPNFDTKQVWEYLLSTRMTVPRVNIFMAVPTMYAKLIDAYHEQFGKPEEIPRTREYIKAMCKEKIRLMVSGSAALPEPIMQLWESLTGHRLLERYGMTEIGMALSNPLDGPRIPGSVGTPLPGVEVQIIKLNVYSTCGYDVIAKSNSKSTHVTKGMENEIGELTVRGPNVFSEYWNRPEATKAAFTHDGFFKTGDTVKFSNGVYSILGRTSADIIKSGGFKISALDVERCLLSHCDIRDAAVVGLPDITWGERVAAVIELHDNSSLTPEKLQAWCKSHLPSYSIPSMIKFVENIPRNVMGKVNKKELVRTVFPDANTPNGLVS